MSWQTWMVLCTRWGTLIALVIATLAPSIAHALRHERGQFVPWQEICTSTGTMRLLALDDQGQPAKAHAYEQCLTCLAHHDVSAPPPAPVAVSQSTTEARFVARLFLHAPRTLHTWAVAQPRAPPLLA